MSERNVEINVKTSSGYDKLRPAGVIANTTPDIDVTGTIPPTRWEDIQGREGWYRAALSVSYMNNYCFPIITIYAEEMSTYYATNKDGVCELQVYGKPTGNIDYHATFLPTSEMPVVPTPCHVSVVAKSYGVICDEWVLNRNDRESIKLTNSFQPTDKSHLNLLANADFVKVTCKVEDMILNERILSKYDFDTRFGSNQKTTFNNTRVTHTGGGVRNEYTNELVVMPVSGTIKGFAYNNDSLVSLVSFSSTEVILTAYKLA